MLTMEATEKQQNILHEDNNICASGQKIVLCLAPLPSFRDKRINNKY